MNTFSKSLLVAGVIAMAFASCNENKSKEENQALGNDPVANILHEGAKLRLEDFEWTRTPHSYVCHMHKATDEVRFGIYACSPEQSSFKAVFTDMAITECAWKAHDGQQPDEEDV